MQQPEKAAQKITNAAEIEQSRSRGLCATCAYAPTCTYPVDAKHPILFCEEFATESLPAIAAQLESTYTKPETRISPEHDQVDFVGLCVNCQSRATCTYPRHEGGIWHCEEYL